jgi:protein-disulfide isomerase
LLFKNYNKLNDQKIQDIALVLAMEQAEFKKSMNEPVIQAKINQDLMDGIRIGVQGIPAVFINGKFIRNRNLAGLQEVIDNRRSRSCHQGPTLISST